MHALRSLRRTPGFTAVAILTLALGIGACTAIFSVVHSVLLRPIAYPESDRLIVLQESWPPQYPAFGIAPANYLDWTTATTDLFENLAAWHHESFSLTLADAPAVHVQGLRATARYFETLRATPLLGQTFGPEHDVPGRNRVVVLSYALWQTHFGGRPDVVGQTLRLNGWPLTVLGVMPATFQREGHADFFTPLAFGANESQDRRDHHLAAIARLKPNVTLEQARARLAVIAAQLAEKYPDTNKGWSIVATPLLAFETAASRATLYTLLGAVAALLLIACANLANLLLARATARQRELSVRAALGANRTRLIRESLVESLLLASAGGVLGVLVGSWALDALLALAPTNLPRAAEISLDATAVLVACGLTLFTALAFGLAPALHASRVDLVAALQDGSRTSSDGRQRRGIRHMLVVLEIALALTLLACAGLLMRSFVKLTAFDLGFTPHGAARVHVAVPYRSYNTDEKLNAFVASVLGRYGALPGVTHAAATDVMPMADGGHVAVIERPGHELPFAELPVANAYAVTPDYLPAAGIQLIRGRAFTRHDRADTAPVALLSQSAAAKLFPGLDPIGQRFQLGDARPPRWREVVGIVSEVKHHGTAPDHATQVYTPFAQTPARYVSFVVRTSGDPAALLPRLRHELHAVDPEQSIARLEPLTQLLSTAIAREKFTLQLFAVFSGAAVLLAALGIYGVTAYSVTRRTAEFGIRFALGAQRSDIARLVLIQALRLTLLGIVLGAAAALFATRLIVALLYQTSPHDPAVFLAVALLMAGTALLACYLPARRAAKVDPITALRAE